MYDAVAFVCFEAGFFDDIVESAGIANLFKNELRVGFIVGYQYYGADTEDTVEDGSSQAKVDYPEHIEVIESSIENTAAPFDSVGGDFVVCHFQAEHFQQQNKENEYHKANSGSEAIFACYQGLAFCKFEPGMVLRNVVGFGFGWHSRIFFILGWD